MRCIVALLLVLSGTAGAAVFEAPDRVWAQLFFGLGYQPGPGDWLSVDGPPWSVDRQVKYVSTPEGRALSVTFAEDCLGCEASGVGVFRDPNIQWLGDGPDFMAFVALTGPPHSADQVFELLRPSVVPEPATPLLLVLGIALLFRIVRARRCYT